MATGLAGALAAGLVAGFGLVAGSDFLAGIDTFLAGAFFDAGFTGLVGLGAGFLAGAAFFIWVVFLAIQSFYVNFREATKKCCQLSSSV